MSTLPETASTAPPKGKKNRSPSYPFIPLKKAIERTKEFWAKENRHPARIAVAVTHWKFGAKSSGGLLTVAALKQFWLLSDSGNGDDRQVQLTPEAIKILLDERATSPERDEIIKAAAIRPTIHADLWKKWGVDLPSDENIRTYLKLDKEFTEGAAAEVLRVYKETLKYAKLIGADIISTAGAESEDKIGAGEEINKMPDVTPNLRVDPPPPLPPAGKTPSPLMTGEGVLTLSVPYRGVSLTVRVEVQGQSLTREHVAKVRKYLELAEEDLDVAIVQPPRPASLTEFIDDQPPQRSSANVASVPVMITKKMETELLDAGYTTEQIRAMTPQRAHENLAKRPT